MNAQIIHDPAHPHGTPEGYADGCKGSHCPAPVKCRDVHTRYVGDYSYRKAIDAGTTAVEIQQQEQEAAHAALEAKRGAQVLRSTETRNAARERHNANRRARRAATPPATGKRGSGTPTTPLQIEVHQLHAQGLTDLEISTRMGKERHQVKAVRSYLRLAPNPKRAEAGR